MGKRLYIVITFIVVCTFIFMGIFGIITLKKYNIQQHVNELTLATAIIEQKLEDEQDPKQASESLQDIFDQIDKPIRVTIIKASGEVLFDNYADEATMEIHLQREEVRKAIKDKSAGTDIHYSKSLKKFMLYHAYYSEELNMVIRVAIPYYNFKQYLSPIFLTLFIIILIGLLLILFAIYIYLKKIYKPINELFLGLNSLGKGNYQYRIKKELSNNRMGVLIQDFNQTADLIEKNINLAEEQNKQLDRIIDHISEALFIVTKENRILFINQETKNLFDVTRLEKNLQNTLFILTGKKDLEEIVTRVFTSGEAVSQEIYVDTKKGERCFAAKAGIFATEKDVVILTLQDITESKSWDEIRSDFVANVSHELRTPLTSIRGFVDTMQEKKNLDEQTQQKFLKIIATEVERLDKLIEDVLLLSSLEESEEVKDSSEVNETQTFDLNVLIDDVAVLLEDFAQENGVSIIVKTEDQSLPVEANADKMKQLLINLIDNAIKYNYQGGKVYLNAWRINQNDSHVCISVKDTGKGFSSNDKQRIFERFYRADKSRTHGNSSTGTGLGLAIVKHIAALYDGRIEVESSIGLGTHFKIELKI